MSHLPPHVTPINKRNNFVHVTRSGAHFAAMPSIYLCRYCVKFTRDMDGLCPMTPIVGAPSACVCRYLVAIDLVRCRRRYFFVRADDLILFLQTMSIRLFLVEGLFTSVRKSARYVEQSLGMEEVLFWCIIV